MRRVLLSTLLLLLMAAPGRAGDFTGFYAGLNAGYAWGREPDRTVRAPAAGPGSVVRNPDADRDLPPSARDAAAAIQRSARRSPGAPQTR
ncbi:hypothetical protein [Methylobacterium sp. CM6257]